MQGIVEIFRNPSLNFCKESLKLIFAIKTFVLFSFLCSIKPCFAQKTVEVALTIRYDKPNRQKLNIDNNKEGFRQAVYIALEHHKQELAKKKIKIKINELFFRRNLVDLDTSLIQAINSQSVIGLGVTPTIYSWVAGEVLKGSNMVYISPLSSGDMLKNFSKNILFPNPYVSDFAKAIKKFCEKTFPKSKRVIVISLNDPAANTLFNTLEKMDFKYEKVFKLSERLEISEKNIDEILSYNPDVIITPNIINVSGSLITKLTKKKFTGSFIGVDTWDDYNNGGLFLNSLAGQHYTAYSVRATTSLAANWKTKRVEEEFKKRTHGKGYFDGVSMMLYYDSMSYIIKLILASNGVIDRGNVLEYIKKYPYLESSYGSKLCIYKPVCGNREKRFSIVKTDGIKHMLNSYIDIRS